MRAAGVDPRGMVAFFTLLQRRYPQREGDLPQFGLASHPPDSERTRLFETRFALNRDGPAPGDSAGRGSPRQAYG
jgi:predicted Zn-dependent protease